MRANKTKVDPDFLIKLPRTRTMTFDLADGDRARLVRSQQGERIGPWPKLIAELQAHVRNDAIVDMPTARIRQGVNWWIKGTGGVPGAGGWQKMFPIKSLAPWLTAAFHAIERPLLSTIDAAPIARVEARVSEEMRRVKVNGFVVRLRLATNDPREADAIVADAEKFIVAGSAQATPHAIANDLSRILQHLRVVEVIDAQTGNGSLVYAEGHDVTHRP